MSRILSRIPICLALLSLGLRRQRPRGTRRAA